MRNYSCVFYELYGKHFKIENFPGKFTRVGLFWKLLVITIDKEISR
jgi:hypothetical protein